MPDAKPYSKAQRDYLESRILSAPPVEVVHLLYQVAIDNLNAAKACLKSGDNFGRSRAVTKAQAAVYELLGALDPDATEPISRNLAELYDYVLREIIAGHTRRAEPSFENAIKVLTTLSEGWSGVRTSVLGQNQTEGESLSLPQEQPVAQPEKEISHFYTEFPRLPATARDWSG
jgi:flagellar secretion chaperone FliS